MERREKIFIAFTLTLLLEAFFVGYAILDMNLRLEEYGRRLTSELESLRWELSNITETLNRILARSRRYYLMIDDGDFLSGFGDAWLREEWNKNEYTVVEMQDGILHLECNNTGEWGNAGVYQGKHIDQYDYARRLLAITGDWRRVYLPYIEYNVDNPIELGEYFLEAAFRINKIEFTNYSITHPGQYGRVNVGITFMIVYNDADIYGEGEKIYFDIVFTGYCVNETHIWNVPKNFTYCHYYRHIHTGYFIWEVRPEEFGEWITLKIDLGYYLNGFTDLIKERKIYKYKIIGFIVFAESSGCYVNVDYDYIRIVYQPH
ncbi:hypothetical protein DRO55_00480 [Candidatus Bathyarchaeota archaeon]|nr:MAG: hypothetical protein DRO55_00480 [Candidatus Bathyarchaeota archaeon]